jgi:hypothetical protein
MSLTKVSYSMIDGAPLYAKDYGVVANGVANDRPAMQLALDAIPTTGGTLILPKGTILLDATYLTLLAKSNVTIQGAGMGATLIDGAAVTGGSPNAIIVLGYTSGAPSPAVLNNVTLRDFSIKGSGTVTTGNIVSYRGINNVTFERLEVYNGYREGLYCDGGNPSFDGLTIRDCYFHDCIALLSNGANTNTLGVSNIVIENNRFERMSTGVYILGQNISICNNNFVDIRGIGIGVGESNLSATRSISGCVISGNNFVGLGKLTTGGNNFSSTYGINSNGTSKIYADGTQDSGIIISNNTFKDSVTDTGHAVRMIAAGGNVKVIGNYASNLTASNGQSNFIDVMFSSDSSSYVGVNGTPVTAYVENNTLQTSPGGIDIQYGMVVLSCQNAYLLCSGNAMEGAIGGAFIYATANGFLPYISLSSDKFSPTMRLYNLLGTDAGLGATSLAVTGTNATTYNTNVSRDVFANLSTRQLTGATPTVSNGLYFYTANASPVSITDFLSAPTYIGKEITVYFNDANTTVVHNTAKIVLNGAANFASSVGSSLTLYKPNVTNSSWYEKSRCKV